ncbi:MAG: GTPase Era [candidate division WOR-3 bacterium]|nr:GTPase Era [candidate division WOR-3 bacterium]
MPKSGFVAIVGPPNVGKSTLLNAYLGVHLSAVSRRPQTTSRNVLGILTAPQGQLVFLDTPGLLQRKGAVYEFMQTQIKSALGDADLALLMVEPRYAPDDELASFIKSIDKPVLLAINKIDLVKDKLTLLPLIDRYLSLELDEVYPISALKGEGLSELLKGLFKAAPEGEPYYPEAEITIYPMRFFAAEAIRESLFELYGEEIPYSVFVEIAEYREKEGRKDLINAVLYVERESQKPIILGRGGEAVKRLGTRARKKIELLSGRSVFLELRVKVARNWRKDPSFIRRATKPPQSYLSDQ